MIKREDTFAMHYSDDYEGHHVLYRNLPHYEALEYFNLHTYCHFKSIEEIFALRDNVKGYYLEVDGSVEIDDNTRYRYVTGFFTDRKFLRIGMTAQEALDYYNEENKTNFFDIRQTMLSHNRGYTPSCYMEEEEGSTLRYRYVSNYGYGDAGYGKRDMTEQEAIDYYNQQNHTTFTKIEEVMLPRYGCETKTHYVEGEWMEEENYSEGFMSS